MSLSYEISFPVFLQVFPVVDNKTDAAFQIFFQGSRAMKSHALREGVAYVTALQARYIKEEGHAIISRTLCGGVACVIALQVMT